MDPKFQTSFIPKQTLATGSVRRSSGGVNLILLLSLIIFFVIIAVSAGLYVYQKSLESSIASLNTQLSAARTDLEPALIQEVERIDTRIESAKHILADHYALTSFFSLLEDVTMKGVSFQSFEYGAGDKGELKVVMKAEATGFTTVALESDKFYENKSIHNPVFTDLNLNEAGKVVFTVSFTIDPNLVRYSTTIAPTPTDSTDMSTTTIPEVSGTNSN